MSEKGFFIMIGTCLVLVWLFGGSPEKKVEPVPVDGLIEAVASVQESLQLLDTSESSNSASPSDRHEKAKREIIIFTSRNCPPCNQWKRCEQAKFEADGWTVAYCNDHNYSLTPHFLIESNNKQTEHRGYLPFEKIGEVLK